MSSFDVGLQELTAAARAITEVVADHPQVAAAVKEIFDAPLEGETAEEVLAEAGSAVEQAQALIESDAPEVVERVEGAVDSAAEEAAEADRQAQEQAKINAVKGAVSEFRSVLSETESEYRALLGEEVE